MQTIFINFYNFLCASPFFIFFEIFGEHAFVENAPPFPKNKDFRLLHYRKVKILGKKKENGDNYHSLPSLLGDSLYETLIFYHIFDHLSSLCANYFAKYALLVL